MSALVARSASARVRARMRARSPDLSPAAVQVYTAHDLYPFLEDEIARRGAARHGLIWHYARPPVEGLEYEMDCRSVPVERRIRVSLNRILRHARSLLRCPRS